MKTQLFVYFLLTSFSSNGQKIFTKLDSILSLQETTRDSVFQGLNYSETYLSKNLADMISVVDRVSPIADRSRDSLLIYEVIYFRGMHTRNSRKHKEALELFEDYIFFHGTKGDTSRQYRGMRTAGALYSREGIWDKSEDYLYQAKKYYSGVNDPKREALTLKALGSLYRRKGESEKALVHYQQALDIFVQINDQNAVASTHNTLGLLHAGVGDIAQAEVHYLKTLEMARQTGNRIREGNSLGNLGTVVKSGEQKVKYNLEAIEVYEGLGMKHRMAAVYYNLAEYYKETSSKEKALEYYEESKSLFEESGRDAFPQLKQSIAYLYALTGNHPAAIKLLKECEGEIETISELSEKVNSYNTMAEAFFEIGNSDKAWEYRSKFVELKDSLVNETQAKEFLKLETEYEVKQKDLQINNLKIEDELKSARINQQRMMIGGSLTGLALLAFLFFRVQSKNQKIEEQNEIINKALSEKDLLLKEIHHRVKNNLQVISSLLGIQSRSIKDETAKEAIKEGRSRVHSMSLIHQNLYQKDNLTGIDMHDYLPKLSISIFDTYNISGDHVKLKTDIEKIKLDVESVIPIGLIVNELVTNSLKYAFPDNRAGNVFVGLKEVNEKLLLTVSDDGVGLDATQQEQKEKSFGHSLIKAFKSKLGAEIVMDGMDGTRIDMFIEKYSKVD